MSPWRLLIRGMVQFYDGKTEAAKETWERLPADRVPRGISRAMLATVSDSLGNDRPVDRRRLQTLANQKSSTSDQQWRKRLREWFENGCYDDIAEQLGRWSRDNTVDAAWINAMRDRVYAQLLGTGDLDEVRRVIRELPPPPWDPKCKLPSAIAKMLSSDPTKNESLTTEIDPFFADLEQSKTLSEIDRNAIIAVLNLQIAFLDSDLLGHLGLIAVPVAEKESERQRIGKRFARDMLERIRRCLQLWPNWDTAYALISNRIDPSFLDNELLTDIHQLRLEFRGDELAVLRDAAYHFGRIGQTDREDTLIQKLIRIAPRDPRVRSMAWTRDVMVFRRQVAAGEIEPATATVDHMSEFLPAELPSGIVSLCRAAISFKSKDDEAAQAHVEDAYANGITRFATTFLMETHAARFKLSANVKKQFRDARKKMMKAPSLEDVAQTCQLCGMNIAGEGDDYPGMVAHRKELITAAKRAIGNGKLGQWTVPIANDVGTFIVYCDDGVLRRRFISELGRYYDWHIVALVRAIENGPEQARYLLREVVSASEDHPTGLPPILRLFARELYEHSRSMSDAGMFDDEWDDDDEDWDEDDDLSGDIFTDVGLMDVPSPAELIDSMPPEMLELFRDDPKSFEMALRATVPAELAKVLLPALLTAMKNR